MTIHNVDVLRARVGGLQSQLQEVLAARDSEKNASAGVRTEAEEVLNEAILKAKAEFDEACGRLEEQASRQRAEIEAQHAQNLERVERAFGRTAAQAEESATQERTRIDDERRRVRADALGWPASARELSDALEEVAGLLERARSLREEIAVFAATVRIRVHDSSDARLPEGMRPARICGTARTRLDETEKLFAERRRESWVSLVRSSRLVTLGCIVLMLHAGIYFALQKFKADQMQTIQLIVPISCFGFLLVTVLFVHTMKQRAWGAIEPLYKDVAEVEALLRHRQSWLKDEDQRKRGELEWGKQRALTEAEERLSARDRDVRRTSATTVEAIDTQKAEAVERSVHHRDRQFAQHAKDQELAVAATREQHERALGEARGAHANRLKQIDEKVLQATDELARRWTQVIEEFQRASSKDCGESRAAHAPWSDPRWRDLKMGGSFPEGVRLGEVRFDVNTLAPPPGDDPRFACPGDGAVSLPLDVAFPGLGSLVLNADGATRDRALGALFNTVLRILCSFPPGKAKFTLFDPVGLGQSFSALMHLADHDETLVGGRIWTEPAHIEKRLAELTEHIEKVIQKYLRNKYLTIDEYNREVGPMAEAYRFLVIADFPSGFSELALERLASIARSGARCGVILLILRDRRQKLPAAADRATLETGSLPIDAIEGGFLAGDKTVRQGTLTVEAPPPPEALNALLRAVGKQSADARRVEIPFEIIAPKQDAAWSLSTESGIRIPLGRAGADRLQHLDLGRGTAQHALIAGKTGSGKSTLFHVAITNAALWYAPHELELYLIDFKKGVEFKTYAVNALPHARVIAIESDREFGVSVLRRVYNELGLRAERFRAREVQEFAGYRLACPTELLPRTLLMIDEFQEFFTEEDAIAQEAALLLDRIVRQGRAFGVHVVLGSQTLGGSYTLAKSTLGQMAVRIALPCSEADSYLILSDDNAAARLLSRPGEAIYNDKAGTIEGNDPFQIAWLPDSVRDAKLDWVRERAARDGVRGLEPVTVFEGNVPADIRKNPLLKERLEKRGAIAGEPCAWIGEANAIKGPTEVRFKNQRGGNLLIVGQQRESALSVACSSIVSLAAAHAPSAARFIVLDGSPPELGHGQHFAELAQSVPHGVEVVDYANIPQLMEELDAEVTGRLDGTKPTDRRIFLFIHDIQRFRKLRQGDELDFSSSEEKKRTPDKCFANVLGEGPALRVHTIVWCDSLSNLQRMLTRKLTKEFDIRVLFQMSATDSSELIDSPQAGKLGLYRGLLFVEEAGTVEKFRPYAMPDAETVRGFGQAMRGGDAASPPRIPPSGEVVKG